MLLRLIIPLLLLSNDRETTPIILNNNRAQEKKHRVQNTILALLVLAILGSLSAGSSFLIYKRFSTDILDPSIRDRIRREWHTAEVNHNLKMDGLRLEEETLEGEIDKRRREETDRGRKEKAEREIMRLYCEDLKAGHSYGTRRYTARLVNFRPIECRCLQSHTHRHQWTNVSIACSL